MHRPSTRERRSDSRVGVEEGQCHIQGCSDSRVGVEEGQCHIQGWIVSRFERGRSPIASRFNWDKEVNDSGLV